MKADNFFPVAYSMPHNPKVENLRELRGGIVAVGQWVVLLSLMYEYGGRVELTDLNRRMLARELETDDIDGLLGACADCGLISAELLGAGTVSSNGVCEQLEYKRSRAECGKKGGRPKKKS